MQIFFFMDGPTCQSLLESLDRDNDSRQLSVEGIKNIGMHMQD